MAIAETVTSTDVKSKQMSRVLTVVGAVLAPVVVWLLATLAFGVDVVAPSFGPGQPTQEVGIGWVIIVGAMVSLAGWGLLALLERFAPARARTIWTVVAAAVLVLSVGGPLSGTGASGGSRAALLLMHVALAAVLITGMWRSAERHAG